MVPPKNHVETENRLYMHIFCTFFFFLAEMPSVGPGVDLRKWSQLDRRGPFILGLTGPSRSVLAQYFESQQSVLKFLWPDGATGINVYWPNSKFTGQWLSGSLWAP